MNTKSSQRVPLPGSERTALPGATKVGDADPNEQLQVSVYVRPGGSRSTEEAVQELSNLPASERRHLSREEFAAAFGADPKDLDAVASFAKDHNLQVVSMDPARRVVVLSGPVAAMSKAFGVELARYDHPDTSYRGREGAITIPAQLDGVIKGVHGLDNRPAARPHVTVVSDAVQPRQDGGPYSPVEVAASYDFPTTGNGQGQCVGILELGGGYNPTDLELFFQNLGITEPTVVSVGVDGATNSPGDPADVEVALD